MAYEELIYEEDYTEAEAREILLETKLNNANDKIEELTTTIKYVRKKIEHDIAVNERCLEEKTDIDFMRLLNLWIEYDRGLLEDLSEK